MSMVTKLKDKLLTLQTYFLASRGSGHTTLMKKGTDNYDRKKFVLLYNMNQGQDLGFKRDECVSWKSLEKLRGDNRPLAIDNCTTLAIIEETLKRINELENDNSRLIAENNRLQGLTDENLLIRIHDLHIDNVLLEEKITTLQSQKEKLTKEMLEHPYRTFFKSIINKPVLTENIYM